MNTDNILAVADAIENHTIPDLGFNMAYFYSPDDPDITDLSGHGCGTTACIGGYASIIIRGGEYDTVSDDELAAWFGVPGKVASQLFYATNHPSILMATKGWFEAITPSQAVAVLRHLAATGEVDWTVPFEAKPETATP